jgi:Uma2 family endonuclease
MSQALRFTSRDLELMPDDGKRREIIDGELYVSKQPSVDHQDVGGRIFAALFAWSLETHSGRPVIAPGVIFAEDDDVVPDVAWISRGRMRDAFDEAGHFRVAPDLVVEILSPGRANEQRDRDAKLKLYSRRAVREYWIVDWRLLQIEVYRRADQQLHLVATLVEDDVLTSPILPGFSLPIAQLFVPTVPED